MNLNYSIFYQPVYFDAGWALHRLVSWFVGAVYSGIVDAAKYFSKFLDFLISPKGIGIENTWTNYGTGSAVSVSVVPTTVTNCYMVAVVTTDNTVMSITSPLLQGVAPTALVSVGNTPRTAIYGTTSYLTSAGTFTCTLSASVGWRCVVYQLSGVNQTTPTVDTDAVAPSQVTPIAVTLTTVDSAITIDGFSQTRIADAPAAVNGQTTIPVNGKVCSGYLLAPTVSSQTVGYSHYDTGTNYATMGAVTINPA